MIKDIKLKLEFCCSFHREIVIKIKAKLQTFNVIVIIKMRIRNANIKMHLKYITNRRNSKNLNHDCYELQQFLRYPEVFKETSSTANSKCLVFIISIIMNERTYAPRHQKYFNLKSLISHRHVLY